MQPKKNYVDELFERNRERKIMLVINAIFFVISLFLFLKGYHALYALIMIACLVFNAVRLFLWIRNDEAKIKDTTDCYINLTKNGLECVQVSVEDCLEECNIKYEDIEKIVESTRKGDCGFYLFLKERNRSVICQNEQKTNRRFFYVDGIGYDYEDFINFYWSLIDRLSDDAIMVGTENQKSWAMSSAKTELLQLIIPYAIIVGLVLIKVIQSFM